jgi:hypothetical protein
MSSSWSLAFQQPRAQRGAKLQRDCPWNGAMNIVGEVSL